MHQSLPKQVRSRKILKMVEFSLSKNFYFKIKRIVDCTISLSLLILLSPLFLSVYLLIYLKMGSPVLFVQARVGKNCRLFHMYKFRSMVNAVSNEDRNYFTSNNDKRVTGLGKILRKFSIDELPQLWNVLIGDMSLIGPRPFVGEQSSAYSSKDWTDRHNLKPGITGLAQVSGRSNLSLEDSLGKDLTYTRRCCIILDCRILLMTLFTLTGKASN